ncbi:MAG: hypothetical protein NC320_13595, partial [Clostridium sp.]|nr:hypothetical protein [Clostridium sp.]
KRLDLNFRFGFFYFSILRHFISLWQGAWGTASPIIFSKTDFRGFLLYLLAFLGVKWYNYCNEINIAL